MQYNKAIRDKIPELIKKSGDSCSVKTMSDSDFLLELDKKLIEELEEYNQNKSVEELADLVEVIQRIVKLRGTSLEKFENIKFEKIKKSGGFEKNLFLIESEKNNL